MDNPPLHALADGVDGPNGVFQYGPTSAFPLTSYNSSNYWVDVVFNFTAVDHNPPTVTATTPCNGASAISLGTRVTATFSKILNASTVSGSKFQLVDPSGAVVPSTVTYDSNSLTATDGDPTSVRGLSDGSPV